MRSAMKWLAVTAVGITLVSACGELDERPGQHAGDPAGGSPDVTPSEGAGAAGAGASVDIGVSAGASGSAGAAGAPSDTDDMAGAGGADACLGNYDCPAVLYASHAMIEVDLPVSVADAADAVFTACRNDECHSAKGSAQVYLDGPDSGWVFSNEGSVISLSFHTSDVAPFAVLDWVFYGDGPIASDHYSLAIQPVAVATPTTLFDAKVKYTTSVADPTLVSEGFCRHCSEVSLATVDARVSH